MAQPCRMSGSSSVTASKEMASNPGPAKEKLKQVKALVDSKSSWYAKADALLKKG